MTDELSGAQLRADYMTIIDFCDAMARAFTEHHRGGLKYMVYAVRQAHDIAHVLEGGDKTLSWHTVRGLLESSDTNRQFGPAWPDVRLRMVDVLARAEEVGWRLERERTLGGNA